MDTCRLFVNAACSADACIHELQAQPATEVVAATTVSVAASDEIDLKGADNISCVDSPTYAARFVKAM